MHEPVTRYVGKRAEVSPSRKEAEIAHTNSAVDLCIYGAQERAEAVASELKSNGFRTTDISIRNLEKVSEDFEHTRGKNAPSLALAGAVAGSVFGSSLIWLIGIGVIPLLGLGPVIDAGPIVASIAGFGGGSAIGAIAGVLVEYKTKHKVREGSTRSKNNEVLLSVRCYDSASVTKARDILERSKAEEAYTPANRHTTQHRAA